MTMLLVDCSSCRTPLQLPPGATSIRCAICAAITRITGPPRSLPHCPYSHYPTPPSNYQPPPPLRQPPPAPAVHFRKKALIVGISYKHTRFHLKGCINDAKCMKYLLMNRFHFPESEILMLTEEERDPDRIPTRQNIIRAMYWLVEGCRAGDSLVFHYSGHGSQQRDNDGDEVDGLDETLCPLDFQKSGGIVDDEINDIIVRPLPRGAKLHAIIDACHSGTVLDLPYLCRMNRSGQFEWDDHRPPISGKWKGTNGGEVISFSGCDDDQKSADTTALSKITSTGAMTYCFIQAIEKGQASTYGSLLNAMRAAIRDTETSAGGGVVISLITMLLTGGSGVGLKQEPQLTANETFDIYAKPFSLV